MRGVHRGRSLLFVLVLAVPAFLIDGASSGAASAPAPRASTPCPGGLDLRVGTGPVSCTHGPDPAPSGLDGRGAVFRTEGPAVPVTPICTGDGFTGPRVQLVYARPTGAPDRYDAFAASFRAWAAQIDAGIKESAEQTVGQRRIRFVHDASCSPTISRVVLPAAATAEFGTFVDQIRQAHGLRTDRRFLVWMDADTYCGVAEYRVDDRPGPENLNNTDWSMVARVDSGCWGNGGGESAEAHELMHTLGAVQPSAPHSTGRAHCSDEIDRMCGEDGSGVPVTKPCPANREDLFDCNHDDYFHTDPVPGSYLATHWNSAFSRFLAQPPPPPADVVAVADEDSATVSWTASPDGDAPVTGYRVTTTIDGVARPTATLAPTASTYMATGLPDGSSVTFTVAATNGFGSGRTASPAAVVPALGSRFHPLPPARILDSRTGIGAPPARVLNSATVDLQVTGRGGVPATGVSAVVLNVTVTEPWFGGYLTVWPTGDTRPLASNLNVTLNQTVANLVTVKVGAGGRVSLFNGAGTLHVIADVAGWYGPSGSADGSRYHAVAPTRILDTRSGNGAPAGRVGAPGALDLQVAGRGGVPATGASAVVLNLTVTEPWAGGFLTAWPAGDVRPLASNLNFLPGQTVPNLATVKLGAEGRVSLYNSGVGAHLVADVAGWFGPDGEDSGARYHPVAPSRILDTRTANGAPALAVGPAGALDLQVTGRGGVPAAGVSAVVLNVTVVDPASLGFLTAWPSGEVRPVASNVNFAGGQTSPNLVVAKVGTGGRISLYNGSGGATHLVADIGGWYGQTAGSGSG